ATRPEIEIVSGPTAMRSTAARVGDRVRVNAAIGEDIRVYRADRLVARCASPETPACRVEERWLIGEIELATAGEYAVVIVSAPAQPPTGSLDHDLAAV